MINSKYLKCIFSFLALSLMLDANTASAGGCAPGQPCWEEPVKQKRTRRPDAPTRNEVVKPRAAVPAPAKEMMEDKVAMEESFEETESALTLAAGINVLYFDCEDTTVAPGIFADYRPDSELPVNIRLGVEGTEVDVDQFDFGLNAAAAAGTDFNFIRIPLSVEYVMDVAEETKVFIGGGPDLIDISGDYDDTIVGLHLGARVQQDITERIGVSLGAGYLFAEADADDFDEDLDLDGAYTGVHLTADLF